MVSKSEMSNFRFDQGRIRRLKKGYGGTNKGLRWGAHLYAAAGNPRSPARGAYAMHRRENADQGKKGHLWTVKNSNGHYFPSHCKNMHCLLC